MVQIRKFNNHGYGSILVSLFSIFSVLIRSWVETRTEQFQKLASHKYKKTEN